MPEAARIEDGLTHTHSGLDILAGVLIGAAVGVLIGVAIVGTGGLAAVAFVAGAGLVGGSLGGTLGAILGKHDTYDAGKIISGAKTVFIGAGRKAARSKADVGECKNHDKSDTCLDDPSKKGKYIAQGSLTVIIEGYHAARKGDKGTCDFVISGGCETVFIGGPTATDLAITSEVPEWVGPVLFGMGIVGGILMMVPAAVAIIGAGSAAGLGAWTIAGQVALRLGLSSAVGFGLSWGGGQIGNTVGGAVFGEGSLGQELTAFGGSALLPFAGKPIYSRIMNAPMPGPDLLSQPGGLPASEGTRVTLPSGRLGTASHPLTEHGPTRPLSIADGPNSVEQRMLSRPNMTQATKYTDATTMETAVSRTLAANQGDINSWLATSPPAGQNMPAINYNPRLGNLGAGYSRVTPGGPIQPITTPLEGNTVVLKSNGAGGYVIQTAYPSAGTPQPSSFYTPLLTGHENDNSHP